MTRKDYVAIAAAIKHVGSLMNQNCDARTHTLAMSQIAESIASTMAGDNPRFDRERFLKACGVQ